MHATCNGKAHWTHSCRPADAQFVPPPVFQAAKQIPGLETVGHRLGRKPYGHTDREDGKVRRQVVQTEVIRAGADIGESHRLGTEEYRLLDVGIHRPEL